MTKKQTLIVEKYLAEFSAVFPHDTEVAHGEADRLILEALRELGFGLISDAWEACRDECGGFWYA